MRYVARILYGLFAAPRPNLVKEEFVRSSAILQVLMSVIIVLVGCTPSPQTLVLATTTSTADSGLLDEILPKFEEETNARVQVLAVGTGQALGLGERGDADVILVHDRDREENFLADGFGEIRRDVMYNDIVILGPPEDPAGISGLQSVTEAFARMADVLAVDRGTLVTVLENILPRSRLHKSQPENHL